MNEWNKLSMADRAAYIKLGIDNGITDLATIRDTYNKYAEGGSTKWTMQDETNYQSWKDKLPDNLKYTDENEYDLRGAYKAGMEPQWNTKDKSYHLGSRDPYSGRILKSPHHPTYLEALVTDASMGYYPSIDNKGNTYTNTWRGNKFEEGGYVREKNDNPIAFDEEGNLVDQVTGEKGTMMLPEFTLRGISPKTKAKNYSSAYHPEDALEFLDIMTRPLTRPFSASQQIGAIRNKINGGTYLGSLLGYEENLGIMSRQFNQQHPYLSMGANMLVDASIPLDIQGIKIANQLRPTNLRKHFYVNRFPGGYNGMKQTLKDMTESILSGNTPNVENYPTWYNTDNAYTLFNDYGNLDISAEDLMKARDDAFRIYLKLPQRNNTFVPYINNKYPQQTRKIFTDRVGISKKREIPLQIPEKSQVDFINSVGGNIGIPKIDIIDKGVGGKTYGVTYTSDIWDLHPFSRKGDRLIDRVIRPTYNKVIRPIIEIPYDKLRKLSQDISYDTQAIKDYIAKHPEELEFGSFDPDMFPSKHYELGQTIKRVNDKVLEPLLYPKFEKIKWLKKLDDKIASFEIGKLIGAEPFEVRYDIPWTKSLEISPKGEFYEKYIKGWDQSDNLPTEAYRFKKDNPNLDYKINK